MASIPPADAPIATIGKSLTLTGFLFFRSIDFLETERVECLPSSLLFVLSFFFVPVFVCFGDLFLFIQTSICILEHGAKIFQTGCDGDKMYNKVSIFYPPHPEK